MSSTPSTVTRNIQGVEEIINYQFTNPKLICEALLAAGSYLPGIVRFSKDGNKNLALVGDAILQLVLVLDGYDKFLYKGENNQHGERERERDSDFYNRHHQRHRQYERQKHISHCTRISQQPRRIYLQESLSAQRLEGTHGRHCGSHPRSCLS